jgi:hypothetical protein
MTDGSKRISSSLIILRRWTPVRTGFASRRSVQVCSSAAAGVKSFIKGRDRIRFAPHVEQVCFGHPHRFGQLEVDKLKRVF